MTDAGGNTRNPDHLIATSPNAAGAVPVATSERISDGEHASPATPIVVVTCGGADIAGLKRSPALVSWPVGRHDQQGDLDIRCGQTTFDPMTNRINDPAVIAEIIEMALSDHTHFEHIRALHGLGPDEVQAVMRQNLKPGSYRAWRKRVRTFADRREVYK